MIWICMLISLAIGIFIGIIIMYNKTHYLLHDQKKMYNELQNNKNTLNSYQKELGDHFNYTIELLNKMAEDYRQLYHNIKKSANFLLPNTHIQDNMYTFHIKKTNINNEQLPIEIPLDYSDNTEKNVKQHKDK